MQSSAFSLSNTISQPKPRKPLNPRSLFRFNPISTPSPPKSFGYGVSASSSSRLPSMCISSSSSSSSSPPPRLNGWISAPPLVPQRESDGFEVRAASVPESADGGSEKSKFKDTLVLGSLFGLWYLFNIYFNIYNKQVLKVYPYPITVTAVQFAVGTALVIFMWTSNLYKRPKISGAQLAAILPLAVVHTLGNLFTNMSLGKVAVSFTHTIKAMEPFFSVVLSAMFLGEISGGHFLFIEGVSAIRPSSLAKVNLDDQKSKVVDLQIIWCSSSDSQPYKSYFSMPEFIEFPTVITGQTTYAYFYPPSNPKYQLSKEEKPPLLLQSHGDEMTRIIWTMIKEKI